MIDLSTETPLSLIDAAKLIPAHRGGESTHVSTILRWIMRGCIAPDGTRVRLDAIRMGSRWITSREALQRFADHLTPRLDDDAATVEVRTPNQRRKAADRASEELTQLGI